MRRLWWLLVALLITSFLVGACSSPASTPAKPSEKPAESKPAQSSAAPSGSEKPAIKVGYLTALTGTMAGLGKDMRDGFLLYLDQKGGQLAGRKVEVIAEDDEGKPDVGLTKAKKLVERDNVQMLAGIVSSAVAYGLADYAKGQKVPLFLHNAG